jgi:hypothetical protein
MIESKHAIEAFDSGVAVVRVKANTKALFYSGAEAWRTPCDCDELRRWIEGGDNWGVHLGASGLVVVDVDGPKGEDSLARCSADFGRLPETLEVRSPRPGGRHLYYRCEDRSLVKKTHALGKGSDLDALAGDQYTAGPGSVFVGKDYSGAYTVTRGSFRDIAPMPSSWRGLFGRKSEISDGGGAVFSIGRCEMRDGRCEMGDGRTATGEIGDFGDIASVFAKFPIPSRGTANKVIFKLATSARHAMPGVGDKPPDAVMRLLHQWIERWQANTEKPHDEIVAHFLDAWERYDEKLFGLGSVAIEAKQAADPPLMAEHFPNAGENWLMLARMCAALQARSPSRPFFLSQRSAAEILRVEQPAVGVWLRRMMKAGALERVSIGAVTFDERKRRSAQASEYLWRW